ncbi:MAG: dihydropteroate synthase, partial [Thermoleophilaceae bacterium]|nr:dihydropteroate synthase [Thermoleophilaceae bacterium]
DIQAVLTTLIALDVQVIGLNCSTGPEDMRDAIRYLGERSPVPVHCIPNAGLPLQGPDGETIFPEEPEPLANTLAEFVERHGVTIVGGCCGTTPDHIAAIVDRVGGREAGPRPAPGPPELSSMMTSTLLAQEPAPTIVGERVNSQGSRRAKAMLLEDDYDGLLQIAEDQVEGGAHVLDLCVALTERDDEDEQMRELAKRVSLTQPAPIQVDSTEPAVMKATLEQIPGRAIVNSVNLEAGRDKLDTVVPLVKAHGAALIALTIDEESMGKTADRKLEIAKRIYGYVVEEHGLDPEVLIFDALTFTLTTGDDEWKPSAIETLEGIRQIKRELPGVKTSLGVSNVSFGVSPKARAVLNSVFLHHAVEAGLDLAMVHPQEVTPYPEIPEDERELTDDLVFNRREDALERFIEHFESKGEEAEEEGADPTADMEPEEALHWHILRRKKEGVEDWIDRSNEKIGAVPTLNQVLLPAMKEVGDKFGAGELILPFVLQSAEVMKRAVTQLERYLDKIEGHTKGKVVIATVFGDVHDIGKSLVNTILTNNGYTVYDLGKQVPVDTIINAAVEHEADAIGLSALLVSTSKQMPICVQELHERGHEFPVLIGGAAINRDFGRRILYPHGKESDDRYQPGVFYCKDAFQGLDTMDELIDGDARAALVEKIHDEARQLREKPVVEDTGPPVTDDSVRSNARTDVPVPEPPFWGPREIDVDLGDVYPHLDRHVLFKLHWGGRGVKGDAWQRLLEGDGEDEGFVPRLERMWREQDYLHPRAKLGYFPAAGDGNEVVVFDPEDHDKEIERLVFPRQPAHDRISIADFYRPIDSGERDVLALQAVTVGSEVTDLMARLEQEGEFSEQLFVHGLGVQAAEGTAEWLHSAVRAELGIPPDQGRRWSWGYPACPDQAEHEKVFRLLGAEEIGLSLSGGHAVEPEQSTVAIIAHHPQAVYFGMKSGKLPGDKSPDEVIAGSDRSGELPDDDPEEPEEGNPAEPSPDEVPA